ncbi:hypothetical protein JBW_01571 [Pelosinus fermentans JBW45]|uniref:Uncharacterized protein n=2 Tax=Pelosinus TaxID=365348 RepID=I9DCH3_9FIRM|nr:hypothetical protein JBW_01571 [Pelosinus fermentans JBW45]
MLWGVTVVSAEITRGIDTFTEGVTINSGINADPTNLKSLYFSKIIQPNAVVDYEIQATRINLKDFIFLDTFMEINIDNYSVQKIAVKEAKKMSLVNKNDIYSNIIVSVPNGIVQEITSAKRIALRFQTAAGSYVYVLPDPVLAEWQQVINTEK